MHVHERMLAIFIFRNVCFIAYLCLECKMQTIGPKDTAIASYITLITNDYSIKYNKTCFMDNRN